MWNGASEICTTLPEMRLMWGFYWSNLLKNRGEFMIELFNSIIRTDQAIKDRSESCYSFLNRSARPAIEIIREELKKWFDEFPFEGKSDLAGRFRSDDDRNHLGAFFELYSHRLLKKQGYTVRLHDEVDTGKSAKPDFTVLLDNKPLYYMECTVYGLSNEDSSGDARLGDFYKTIEKINSPNFFIGVEITNKPKKSLPGKRAKSELENWLATLDPNAISKEYIEHGNPPPKKKIDINGWTITFTAIPKNRETKSKLHSRMIGMEFSGAHWVNCKGPLLNALKSKGGKYGELELPYVISVNSVLNPLVYPDEEEIEQVLFGDIKYKVDLKNDSVVPFRESNGFWIKNNKPINSRVSATLIGIGITPWTIQCSSPILWHNPWAKAPLCTDLWMGQQKLVDHTDCSMRDKEGLLAREILVISEDWLYTE